MPRVSKAKEKHRKVIYRPAFEIVFGQTEIFFRADLYLWTSLFARSPSETRGVQFNMLVIADAGMLTFRGFA